MKRFVFLAVFAALIGSGVAAFADTPAVQQGYITDVQQWVGRSSDQLVQQMGKPDVTAASNDGSKVYEYIVRQPNGNARTDELTFEVASNGNVVSASSAAL